MKKAILFLLIIFSVQICQAEIVIDQLPDVEYRNSDGTRYMPDASSYPQVTKMERQSFGQTYENEPVEVRLNRLEEKIYRQTFPDTPLSQRVENVNLALDEMSVTKSDKSTLSSLERKMFNQTYTQEGTQDRVTRLERHILGANQNGDLNARINTLKTASSSIQKTPMPAQYNPYQPQNGVKNAFKNALGFFSGGTLTGYTPPVNYNSNYYPQYQQAYAPNTGFNGLYRGNYSNMPNSNFTTYTPYNQAQKQGFYYPTPQGNTYFQDVFGDSGGNEMYYNDGQYRKDMRTTGGGCGVTIIQ